LIFRDERRKKGFNAGSNDFGQDFIGRVIERDGPESCKGRREIFFGD